MKNLKIRTKLFLLVTFMLAGLVSVGIIALMFMNTINQSSTEIAKNSLPSVVAAEEMNTALSDVRVKEYKHVISTDAQEMSTIDKELDSEVLVFNQNYDAYQSLISGDIDRKLIQEIKSLWDSYLSAGERMVALSAAEQQSDAMVIMNNESRTLFDQLTAKCTELVEYNKSNADIADTKADENYASAQKLTISILVSLSVLSLLFSMYMVRSITRPVKEIDGVAQKIADGNLNESITYQSKDELGVLAINFNKTVSRLRDYVNYIDEIAKVLGEIAGGNLVFELTYDYAGEFAKVKTALENISDSLNNTMSQINQSADQVSSGSNQVSSGAQALSQGATEQASSVEELAATINEISGQVNQSAKDAAAARSLASRVGDEMLESNDKMQQLITAMGDISESSSEIGKIIKTIEDIAFQTNILALNAAVEAARAGAAGKGFAVVADEVRNLASKSAEASKDTAALIERSIHAVENGTRMANETGSALLTAVDGAKEVTDTVDRISQASASQANSINQVTQGVDQISAVVQTNSATAEESAAASEELSGQAQMLKSLVSRFRLRDSSGYVNVNAGLEEHPSSYAQMDPVYAGDSKY